MKDKILKDLRKAIKDCEKEIEDFSEIVNAIYDKIMEKPYGKIAKLQHHDDFIIYTGADICEFSRSKNSANLDMESDLLYAISDHDLVDLVNESRGTNYTYKQIFEEDDPRNFEEIDLTWNLDEVGKESSIKNQIKEFIDECKEMGLPIQI